MSKNCLFRIHFDALSDWSVRQWVILWTCFSIEGMEDGGRRRRPWWMQASIQLFWLNFHVFFSFFLRETTCWLLNSSFSGSRPNPTTSSSSSSCPGQKMMSDHESRCHQSAARAGNEMRTKKSKRTNENKDFTWVTVKILRLIAGINVKWCVLAGSKFLKNLF